MDRVTHQMLLDDADALHAFVAQVDDGLPVVVEVARVLQLDDEVEETINARLATGDCALETGGEGLEVILRTVFQLE